MTNFVQFCARAKMRHDFSDMIQIRYSHPSGEDFDTWISGEEVESRLKTMSREDLIRSFGRMNWQEAKSALQQEIEAGKGAAKKNLRDRLADSVDDHLGGNIFGETIADQIRGQSREQDSREREQRQWQQKLRDQRFRAVALELAWINLEGTFPPEVTQESDDWI